MIRKTLVSAALFASAAAASAAVVDTTAAWNGSDALQPFGSPNTSTYGQVVKASGSQLDSFSFIVDLPDTLQFKAYAYAWDGVKATGPALFTSGVTSDNGSGFNSVAFSTGGAAVTNGQDYVLFLSISELYAANNGAGTGVFASVDAASYADGDFYWFNDGGNFAALTSQNWEKWFPGDFAFTATFTDGADNRVPEPGLLALLGIGALGLAASKRRKAA
ncbi:MAG: PEP-CTERM sorting domain-containing protein [Chitinivorax sp.]